jgi:hypothetical protein
VQAAFYAICTMLVSVLLLLALPFITFGVPALGTLALSCVGMVFGTVMGATRQTGQTDRMRWLRAVLLLPFMLAGLIPGVNAKLVFAPAPVAGTVLLAAGFLIVTGLRFRPAMAAAQDLALEDLHDAAAERGLKTRFCKFFIFLRSLMVWRPWFMPLNPLPVAFAVQVAPVGSLVLLSLQCGVFIVLMPAFACVFSGEHFLRALREQAPTSLALSFAISLMAGGQWLIKREDWPVLFSIGRYGGRQNFTRSMFAAFRINILQTGLSNIVIVVTVGRLLGVLPAGQVVPAAMVLFGLFFGGSYAPALPLLWKEFGGKGYLVAFNLAGYLALLLTAELMVFGARVWPVAYVLAAGFFLAGVFVSVLAPRQLAEMDWPVETEPGWDD